MRTGSSMRRLLVIASAFLICWPICWLIVIRERSTPPAKSVRVTVESESALEETAARVLVAHEKDTQAELEGLARLEAVRRQRHEAAAKTYEARVSCNLPDSPPGHPSFLRMARPSRRSGKRRTNRPTEPRPARFVTAPARWLFAFSARTSASVPVAKVRAEGGAGTTRSARPASGPASVIYALARGKCLVCIVMTASSATRYLFRLQGCLSAAIHRPP